MKIILVLWQIFAKLNWVTKFNLHLSTNVIQFLLLFCYFHFSLNYDIICHDLCWECPLVIVSHFYNDFYGGFLSFGVYFKEFARIVIYRRWRSFRIFQKRHLLGMKKFRISQLRHLLEEKNFSKFPLSAIFWNFNF